MKGYQISLWFKGGKMLAAFELDAKNKQHAKDLGREMADSLASLIEVHYASMGHNQKVRLNVVVHPKD